MKVEPTYIYRRYFDVDDVDNVETRVIEVRWFIVDDPMLFQR